VSRAPSEKTQLATAKRMVRDLQTEVRNLAAEVRGYRARATQAEQQCAEWKQRFDKLLEFRQLLKVE
jgi:outer membrane murein-binding lipoprotein Lpp